MAKKVNTVAVKKTPMPEIVNRKDELKAMTPLPTPTEVNVSTELKNLYDLIANNCDLINRLESILFGEFKGSCSAIPQPQEGETIREIMEYMTSKLSSNNDVIVYLTDAIASELGAIRLCR